MISKRGSCGHQSTPVTAPKHSKPASSLSTRQTGTIYSGAMDKTGPSTAIVAPTIPSGTRLSIAIAVGFSANTSGSTFRHPLPHLALFIDRPVQHALFPDIKKSAKHQCDKQQHLGECKQ